MLTCSRKFWCMWTMTTISAISCVIMLIIGSIGIANRSGLCPARCKISDGIGVSMSRSYECAIVHYTLDSQPYCDINEMGPFCTITCQCWGSATCFDNTSSIALAPLLLYTTNFKYPYSSECDQVPDDYILSQCSNNCDAYQISLRGYQRDCWLSPTKGGFYLGYGLEQVQDLLLVIFGSIGVFTLPLCFIIYIALIRDNPPTCNVVPPYLVTQGDMGLSEGLPEGPPPAMPPSPARTGNWTGNWTGNRCPFTP